MSEEDKNFPSLYWTPKLHKVPFKHPFIAGSSKCTTKDLSCLLTKESIAECFHSFEIVDVFIISRAVSLRSSMDCQSSVSDEFRRFADFHSNISDEF